MKKVIIILISLILINNICYGEGDFWRDEKKETLGWKIIDQDFSHIIYQDPTGQLWTRCHSDMKFLKLEEAKKVILDERKIVIKRLNWAHRSLFQKIKDYIDNSIYLATDGRLGIKQEAPMITMVGDRILDYEELYYCPDHKFLEGE